jgi:signal transduction histidine kinase
VAAEAARLHRLADDLTALSQAEEGALQLNCVATDLASLAGEAIDKLRVQFDHREVELHFSGSAAPVTADPDRITQVLINLLGNALTHTEHGGSVTIETGTGVETSWVTVTDTGAGIAPEDLERIFERFYRIPNPQHPAGRGIGLTIARNTARAHSGEVTATSPGIGRGATFRLTLPARTVS